MKKISVLEKYEIQEEALLDLLGIKDGELVSIKQDGGILSKKIYIKIRKWVKESG
jgi:hypothetical protein